MNKDDLISKNLKLIPISEVNISYDSSKTEAGDFTVEDYFTFATSDGIFVQDTISIYRPISNNTIEELKDKMISTKNLINVSDSHLTFKPSQDIVLGIYLLTSGNIKGLNYDVKFKGKKIKKYFELFNKVLPENYPLVLKTIDKKELIYILEDISENYEKYAPEVLDQIKILGFKYATLYGCTMSLNNCVIKDSKEIKEKIFDKKNTNIDQLHLLSEENLKNILRDRFKYSYLIDSGSRGTWDQVKQLILSRGFISNFKGEIINKPIKNGLIDGLNPEEFFLSSYGSRKGLLDVAINTGTSGYLSRKLIFACINLLIDFENEDCETEKTLNVFVENEKKAESLIYRNYIDEQGNVKNIDKKNYKEIIGKNIKLRSPIYCKGKNICKTCYGNLYKYLNSKFIGILAALALGERNTQLVLRTFHTSGSAVIRDNIENSNNDDDNDIIRQQDVISDLNTASSMLHKFEENLTPEILVNNLYNVYNSSGSIHHIHFECVISQLMVFKNNRWRTLEDRENKPYEWKSIQAIPQVDSWLSALAFSHAKRSLIEGIKKGKSGDGIFDRILYGEKI